MKTEPIELLGIKCHYLMIIIIIITTAVNITYMGNSTLDVTSHQNFFKEMELSKYSNL